MQHAVLPLCVPQDNYGQDDKGKVQAVKAVYRELQLEAVFK